MTVASVVLSVLFAAVAGWLGLVLVAYVQRGIDRRLPDAGMKQYRIGRVQKYSGFDERPTLRYRRAQLAREIRQLQAHKRYLDDKLNPSSRQPVSIDSKRRAMS